MKTEGISTVPRRPARAAASTRRQRGASMIELLVSLLIFAFGTLGIIGMMTRTLGYSQMSLYRSQAAALTDDILDRMRADPANARAGNWHAELDDAASTFTGTTIAQQDLKDWKTQVETLLPSGQAEVIVSSGAVTVTIAWHERNAATTSMVTNSAL
jgi:type IV pilus assembly protein PilV